MRVAIGFLAMFAIAAALALFAGNNHGTVTVFWPPWRVGLSLNLTLLLLLAVFTAVYVALRALSALFSLPRQARQWRLQQKERELHMALLDALAQQLAGRFTRARKSALAVLAQEKTLAMLESKLPQAVQVRMLAHLLAAESAQALQDGAGRDEHLRGALAENADRLGGPSVETREGVLLRAASWALDGHDAAAALAQLAELPQGAQRRTLALRLHLRASHQNGRIGDALVTARLLAKHRAFAETAARSIVRGLAVELLADAHDPAQLQRAWNSLEAPEREMPEVAIHAAQRMMALQGDGAMARAWLLPVWESMAGGAAVLNDQLRVKLVRVLEAGLDSIDAEWLARIEQAQRADPRDAQLQYLAGMACFQRQLWGKAQQLLTQATLGLEDAGLCRRAWRALACLAEERGDAEQAVAAWKRAAQVEPGNGS